MSKSAFAEHNRINWRGIRPAHYGEQIIEHDSVENGTKTLYSIPSDYTLLVSNIIMCIYALSNGTGDILYCTSAGVAIKKLARLRAYQNNEIAIAPLFWPPLELTGDNIINIVASTGITLDVTIFGQLVDNDYFF